MGSRLLPGDGNGLLITEGIGARGEEALCLTWGVEGEPGARVRVGICARGGVGVEGVEGVDGEGEGEEVYVEGEGVEGVDGEGEGEGEEEGEGEGEGEGEASWILESTVAFNVCELSFFGGGKRLAVLGAGSGLVLTGGAVFG